MNKRLAELLRGKPVITDGAWGTQLQARGLPVGACPEAWNLDAPGKVEAVARSYVEAGSRVILTNSFGGNRFVLERHGLEGKGREINRAAAEISVRAAAGRARVFASIGPSGKMLMMGDVAEDELLAAFSEQAEALAAGGVDGLVVETMGDVEEARLAVRAARRTGLVVVASMTFDSGAERDRTMMGTTPEQAAEALAEEGADVLGANCGQGIEGYAALCGRLKAATDRPLWMKPNAGLPEMVQGRTVYRTSPEAFAAHGPALVAAGADFIGGCCGSSPDFIRALAESLRTLA